MSGRIEIEPDGWYDEEQLASLGCNVGSLHHDYKLGFLEATERGGRLVFRGERVIEWAAGGWNRPIGKRPPRRMHQDASEMMRYRR